MTPEQEIQQTLSEQNKVKETLATEGAKIIYAKLLKVADEYVAKEQTFDPFTAPGEIIKARQLRHVIKVLLPQIVEGLVNYDPDAPDQQAAPADKWSIMQWIKKVLA